MRTACAPICSATAPWPARSRHWTAPSARPTVRTACTCTTSPWRAAGRGIGPALVRRNLEHGRSPQIKYSALVSVQGSEDFWARLGYVAETELESVQQRNLDSYRVPALYMVKPLH